MQAVIISLVLKFLMDIGLLLFEYFKSKYGPGLMDWALDLVHLKAQEISLNKTSKLQALVDNAKAIQEVTANSPKLSLTECILINQAAYSKYVSETNKQKFDKWGTDREKVRQHNRNKVAEDFMSLYK